MAYDNDPNAPNRSTTKTGSAKPKAKTKKPKTTTPTAPAGPLFDWGDGHGKVHSIPAGVHKQNVEAQGYGIDLNAPATALLTTRQIYGQAQAGADREFNPQINALQTTQASLEPWYRGYVNDVTSAQNASNAYAQPLLNQAQGWANQAPSAAPGLDPNSAAGQQSAQAAGSGQSLAQLGASVLAAIPVASNAYFSGLQTTAAKDLPQAKTYYGQQVGEKQAERGARVQELYGQGRAAEQNYGLAAQTLLGNQSKSQAEIDIARGVDPVTHKPLPTDPEKPVTSGPFAGLTTTAINGLSPEKRQRLIDKYNTVTHPPKTPKDPAALTPAEQRAAAKAKEKHKATVQAATGKLRSKITDIMDYRQGDVGGVTEDTTKPKNIVTGDYPTRKVTQKDIDSEKVRKYGTLGKIAIAVRDGKKLTQEQIDYLHQLDPNYRIPSEWLPGGYQKTPAQRSNPHGTGKTPDKAPGGAHGHI